MYYWFKRLFRKGRIYVGFNKHYFSVKSIIKNIRYESSPQTNSVPSFNYDGFTMYRVLDNNFYYVNDSSNYGYGLKGFSDKALSKCPNSSKIWRKIPLALVNPMKSSISFDNIAASPKSWHVEDGETDNLEISFRFENPLLKDYEGFDKPYNSINTFSTTKYKGDIMNVLSNLRDSSFYEENENLNLQNHPENLAYSLNDYESSDDIDYSHNLCGQSSETLIFDGDIYVNNSQFSSVFKLLKETIKLCEETLKN
ncbi:unnamed protein product [Gordionus sp. m RMFG-2023]